MMKPRSIPRWVWFAGLLVIAGQAVAFVLLLAGKLRDYNSRNIVPLVLMGGAIVLLALAAYVFRYFPDSFPHGRERLGLILLTLIALSFTGVYGLYARPFVTLPYDLASWSENFFVNDVIKWRTSAPVYLDPDDSNSSVYTFAAPMLTYFFAWVLGHPTSIPLYRLIQQFYLVFGALFGAAATWNLVKLAMPERSRSLSRLWLVFFALASFLFATNRATNLFAIFLHTDAMTVLATTLAFWLMTKHALTYHPRWLWAMAVIPSMAFLVKQYLAIWAVVYLLYLWLDGRYSLRRTVAFGTACFGALGVTIGVCLAVWGDPFRYWVLDVLGQQVISLSRIFNQFGDAAWGAALGLLGGAVLLRGQNLQRLLGMWVGWLVMIPAGLYTAGIAYAPTHLGPATMVGGCFFLAAVATLWPVEQAPSEQRAQQWCQVGLYGLLVLTVFAGMGHPVKTHWSVPADFTRYVREIEREFKGLPTDHVLTDFGEWIYLRDQVVMKDRAAILSCHHMPYFGMIDRLRRKEYARILVRNLRRDDFAYDRTFPMGVRKELLANYREVRCIAGVQGLNDWIFYQMLLSDISVLEPLPGAKAVQNQCVPNEGKLTDDGPATPAP